MISNFEKFLVLSDVTAVLCNLFLLSFLITNSMYNSFSLHNKCYSLGLILDIIHGFVMTIEAHVHVLPLLQFLA